MSYRGRFAPSPTGPLHAGSIVAALASKLDALAHGGSWLVRIEDIDPPREVKGASDSIIATLDALRLRSDLPVLYQHTRIGAYEQEIERLLRIGAAFECRCSRSDLVASGGIHRGVCVASSSNKTPAIRWRALAERVEYIDHCAGLFAQRLDVEVGDVVLRRADGLIAYQLAVVVDDAYQGITDVVRGDDLLDSTPRQIALGAALGYPPLRYLHVPVVRGANGAKLSKQNLADGVDATDPLAALAAAAKHLQLPSAASNDIDAALGLWTEHWSRRWRDQNAQLVVST